MKKYSVDQLIEILYTNHSIIDNCIKDFLKKNNHLPNHNELLNLILAILPLDLYTKEEQKQLYSRIDFYLYNELDEDDQTEFRYPDETLPLKIS